MGARVADVGVRHEQGFAGVKRGTGGSPVSSSLVRSREHGRATRATFMLELGGVFPNGRHAAISFTYDGGLDRHLDEVIPQLESFDLRGTFYVPTRAPIGKSFR